MKMAIATLVDVMRRAVDSIEEGRIGAESGAGSLVTLHPSFQPIIDGFRGCYARIVSRYPVSLYALPPLPNITAPSCPGTRRASNGTTWSGPFASAAPSGTQSVSLASCKRGDRFE